MSEACASDPLRAKGGDTGNGGETLVIPDVCGTLSDGAHMGGGLNGQDAYTGRVIPVAHSLRADGFDASEDGTGRGTPLGIPSPPAVAFQSSQSGVRVGEAHATLDSNNGSRRHNGVIQGMAVRRLTPRECERLQGFPDDYTDIPWRGKKHAPSSPRYKALGNSMAVNVMGWIGQRIDIVAAHLAQREAA